MEEAENPIQPTRGWLCRTAGVCHRLDSSVKSSQEDTGLKLPPDIEIWTLVLRWDPKHNTKRAIIVCFYSQPRAMTIWVNVNLTGFLSSIGISRLSICPSYANFCFGSWGQHLRDAGLPLPDLSPPDLPNVDFPHPDFPHLDDSPLDLPHPHLPHLDLLYPDFLNPDLLYPVLPHQDLSHPEFPHLDHLYPEVPHLQ